MKVLSIIIAVVLGAFIGFSIWARENSEKEVHQLWEEDQPSHDYINLGL